MLVYTNATGQNGFLSLDSMEFHNTGLAGVGWESGFSFIKHVINCCF